MTIDSNRVKGFIDRSVEDISSVCLRATFITTNGSLANVPDANVSASVSIYFDSG